MGRAAAYAGSSEHLGLLVGVETREELFENHVDDLGRKRGDRPATGARSVRGKEREGRKSKTKREVSKKELSVVVGLVACRTCEGRTLISAGIGANKWELATPTEEKRDRLNC